MPDIRTFIAVLLTADLRRKIAEVQEQFVRVAPEAKWVAEDNLHVTVKFLGDVDEGRLGDICSALESAVEHIEPFSLGIAGVGAFPNARRPRTVWVGLDSGAEQLAALAGNAESELAKLGFPRENRPFSAHVTIGRVKPERPARALPEALGSAEVGEIGILEVAGVAVMKSDLQRGGPVYSVLKEIALKPQGGGGS